MVQTRHTIEVSRREHLPAASRACRSAPASGRWPSHSWPSPRSTAPSSLYGLYEQQEHLSSLTITIVYPAPR